MKKSKSQKKKEIKPTPSEIVSDEDLTVTNMEDCESFDPTSEKLSDLQFEDEFIDRDAFDTAD